MNATPTFGRLGDHAVDRRRFLGLIATGAAVVGIPGLLTACSTTPTPSATNAAAAAGDVIPKYIPVTYIDPDYPSVNGSVPGLRVDPGRARAVRQGRPGHRRGLHRDDPAVGHHPAHQGQQVLRGRERAARLGAPVPDHRRQRLRRQAGHGAGLRQGRARLGLRSRPGTCPRGSAPRSSRTCSRTSRRTSRATRSRRTRTWRTSPRTRGSSASSTASSTACRSPARSSPTRSSTAVTCSRASASRRTSRTARTSSTWPSS